MMERNNCSKMIKQDIQMIELEQGEEIEFDGISIKTKVSSPRKKIEHSVEK